MVNKIRDLIHFEDVEEVIKIRKQGQEDNIVSKYVISKKIKDHLIYMFELLNSDTHKSFNIIGNYGTGKSHFLAFIAALLEKKDTRKLISEEEIKEAALKFKREFVVVKFECPAAKEVPLRKIFYDNVQRQLEEKYDFDIEDINLEIHYDNKENIGWIIDQIKEENPELGLLVIVDEISDFLKQKDKNDMTYDLNFLRELGEASQEYDFLYIGAMQEHVFTDPKYVEQAKNIARISERFVDITITKEDINRVISQRIVSKTANQRVQLEEQLSEFQRYFTNFAAEIEKYINLYPIHPYVINVFEQLPYFENRGILHFSSKNVKESLDKEVPYFITYDKVYDLIDETHEIRNLDEVSEIVSIVKILQSKIDVMEERLKEPAFKIIKALAVLKMMSKTHMNGATVQELANTLFIKPASRTIISEEMTEDNVRRILYNIIKITNGQFIDHDKDSDYFYINVNKVQDFDVLIEKKIEKQDIDDWKETFKNLLISHLNLNEQNQYDKAFPVVFEDTAFWSSRRSYRQGYIIIGQRNSGPSVFPQKDTDGNRRDYKLILHSPFANHDTKQTVNDELIIGVEFNEEVLLKLKRISATESLIRDGVFRQELQGIYNKEMKDFYNKYLQLLTTEGYAIHGGRKEFLCELPVNRFDHVSDVLEHFKSHFFEGYFNDLYPKYPIFKRDITLQNIKNEIVRSITNLDKITSLFGMDENAQSYLTSFHAQKDGKIMSDGSEYMQYILNLISQNTENGEMTQLEVVVDNLSKKPFGLQKELVYFLLVALLYNGEMNFVKSGGVRLFAHDFSNHFKSNLQIFESIKYIEEERELNIGLVSRVFDAIGVQSTLLKNKNTRVEAVKEFNGRIVQLRQEINDIKNGLIRYQENSLPELPWSKLYELIEIVYRIETYLEGFINVRKVTDLNNIKANDSDIEIISSSVKLIAKFTLLLNDLEEIRNGLEYQRQVSRDLDKLSSFVESTKIEELKEIQDEQKEIYLDVNKFLKDEYRRPLKGKFLQFKEKYSRIYYKAHEKAVGNSINWERLDQLIRSEKYRSLNQLKGVPFFSPQEFRSIDLKNNALNQQKCLSFDVESLKTSVTCPNCHFPLQLSVTKSIDQEVEEQFNSVCALWDKWENNLLEEVGILEEKVDLLSKVEYRKAIEELISQQKLKEVLNPYLVPALLELTSDLKKVDFNINEFSKMLRDKSSVLTIEELEEAFQDFKEKLLYNLDKNKVRIRITQEED
ncbi:DUF6079 family protein [Bacillus toyonensis]|uniref:DUF6079 family protein n=1 Tax=Bacillus toyonensis TaxID=155322 RepID=UPI000BF79DA4|nr:DUF6079 family protein [Bacillus toyonensis]PGB08060.1 hypothetical protein COM09_29270 [Bacillus toyonensis]